MKLLSFYVVACFAIFNVAMAQEPVDPTDPGDPGNPPQPAVCYVLVSQNCKTSHEGPGNLACENGTCNSSTAGDGTTTYECSQTGFRYYPKNLNYKGSGSFDLPSQLNLVGETSRDDSAKVFCFTKKKCECTADRTGCEGINKPGNHGKTTDYSLNGEICGNTTPNPPPVDEEESGNP